MTACANPTRSHRSGARCAGRDDVVQAPTLHEAKTFVADYEAAVGRPPLVLLRLQQLLRLEKLLPVRLADLRILQLE